MLRGSPLCGAAVLSTSRKTYCSHLKEGRPTIYISLSERYILNIFAILHCCQQLFPLAHLLKLYKCTGAAVLAVHCIMSQMRQQCKAAKRFQNIAKTGISFEGDSIEGG